MTLATVTSEPWRTLLLFEMLSDERRELLLGIDQAPLRRLGAEPTSSGCGAAAELLPLPLPPLLLLLLPLFSFPPPKSMDPTAAVAACVVGWARAQPPRAAVSREAAAILLLLLE